ncbi:MAG: winged helix-turn-helix domain-containing protein [Gammaproteobacteria bacterium]|nr:winged helix-turn-helix domain-containing protein [Gammaproteobacteria bacterium]
MGSNANSDNERATFFRLDRWVVHPQRNELVCLDSGKRHSLEPRLMRLLCLLATAPQRVFSRDELMSHLWPRVIVNENSLTRAVAELRKQLNHAGITDKLIQTVPKIGYRLATEYQVQDYITELEKSDSSHQWTRSAVLTAIRSSVMSLTGMATAVPLVVGAIIGVMLQMQSPFEQQHTPTRFTAADINLSGQAAFNALVTGRQVGAPEQTNVNGEAGEFADVGSLGAFQPVVSHDGDLFAYIHYNEQGSSLVVGSTQLPGSTITVFTTQDSIYNLQWSPADRALLFAHTPRLSSASLVLAEDQAMVVLFDLENFTTRIIDRPAATTENHEDADHQRHSS